MSVMLNGEKNILSPIEADNSYPIGSNRISPDLENEIITSNTNC